MTLHPGDQILFVHERGRRVLPAEIVACFSNPEGAEGDWFNVRTGVYDPAGTALRVRDEGVTWVRRGSATGSDELLAAFVLEQSA